MNRLYNHWKKTGRLALLLMALLVANGCQQYLDVVPDNVSTIDHAFKLRNEAEKYLFTCYSYLPKNADVAYNTAMLAGDEMWMPFEKAYTFYSFFIARGRQRTSNTYVNAWDGAFHGAGGGNAFPMWDGIRHCNTFIENVSRKDKVLDLTDDERVRWIGEAEFLKAYYHFHLMRMYGPIPLIKENLGVDAPEEEVNVERKPIDECVNYIVELLDSATVKLPASITSRSTDMGRITKSIALAVKTQVLLTAASPLFNGNTDYSTFKNKKGEHLFNQAYDENKWRKASEAAKAAISMAEANGHSLYYFTNKTFALSETTITQMSLRQAVCEPWNSEVVWGFSNSRATDIQRQCMVPLIAGQDHRTAEKVLSPPIKVARQFYSKNGVPIDEDKELNFSNITELKTATKNDRFNIREGYTTSSLHFNREPRFYASLSFDGGVWYKYDSPTNSDENTYFVEAKYGSIAGSSHAFFFNETGYFIKKLVDWNMALSNSVASYKTYPWPEIRLADLYLMFAEAKNEADGPGDEVFQYLNMIRERAGLSTVQSSWTNYSTNPNKFQSKDGLREIIHQERLNELAFEGKRYWDMRRWKKAAEFFNQPITGWNMTGSDAASFYQIRTVFRQEFISPRDYFWPIEERELLRNPNLIQNPGW